MHQQCWCWGQDMVTSESAVAVRIHPGTCAVLNGNDTLRNDFNRWGALGVVGLRAVAGPADGEQVFFSRHERGVWLVPRLFEPVDIHTPDAVQRSVIRPSPGEAFAKALWLAKAAKRWCETYEQWVIRHAGVEHRRATLQSWEHPLVAAKKMPSAWRQVRQIYERWYRADRHDFSPVA